MREMAKRILVSFIFTVAIFSLLYLAIPKCSDCYVGDASKVFNYTVLVNSVPEFNGTPGNVNSNYFGEWIYDFNCTDKDGHPIRYYDDSDIFDINETTGLVAVNFSLADVGGRLVTIFCYDGFQNGTYSFNLNIGGPPSSGGSSGGRREKIKPIEECQHGIDIPLKSINFTEDDIEKLLNDTSKLPYNDRMEVEANLNEALVRLRQYRDHLDNVKGSLMDCDTKKSEKAVIQERYENLRSQTIRNIRLVYEGESYLFDNVVVIDSTKGLHEIHFDILEKLDFTEEERIKVYDQTSLSPVWILVRMDKIEVEFLDGHKEVRTILMKHVVNEGEKKVYNVNTVMNVPKDVASDVFSMQFEPSEQEVIQPDPIIRWELGDLEPAETRNFSTMFSNNMNDGNLSGLKFIVVYGTEPGLIERPSQIREPSSFDNCLHTFAFLIVIFLLLSVITRFFPHDKEHHIVIRRTLQILLIINLILAILSLIFSQICFWISVIVMLEIVVMLLIFLMVETLSKRNKRRLP